MGFVLPKKPLRVNYGNRGLRPLRIEADTMGTDRQFVDPKLEATSIPLMMKRYRGGWITDRLLGKSFKNKIKMSQAMGRGLCLDKIRKGRVVLFAGGTGLYPFVDLIDILFKMTLLQKRIAHSPQEM